MAEKPDIINGLESLFRLFDNRPEKSAAPPRIGISGTGPLAPLIFRAYSELVPATALTFFHPDEKVLKRAARELPVCNTTHDPDKFIDAVDAVEILDTGAGRHDLILSLLAAGKHISLNKPYARTLEEADELAAARKYGAILRVNEYALFYEPYIKLKYMLDSMEIGEVCAVRIHANLCGSGGAGPQSALLKDDGWLFHPAFDKFALAIELLGEIESVNVYASAFRQKKGGRALVGFKYKAPGRYGFLDLTYAPDTAIRAECIPCDDRIEIAGTDGIIWANHFHGKMTEEPWLEVRRGKKHYSFGIGSDMQLDFTHCIRASAAHFIDCITGGRKPMLSPRHARRALAFQLAAREAAESGDEIKL